MNVKTLVRNLTWTGAAALLFLSAGAGALRAQAPAAGEKADQYAAKAKENATLLRQYSWKMRIETTIKGETKPAAVYQLRFDLDGKLQKTLLTAPAEEPSGLGKRFKAKKQKEAKEWAEDLAEVVKRYLSPSPGNMMDFFAKAKSAPAKDGTAQVTASGFLDPGDTATFWVNRETRQAVRYAFSTKLQGDQVQGKVDFRQVPDGPHYPARILVQVPAKQASAKVETFDYLKQ